MSDKEIIQNSEKDLNTLPVMPLRNTVVFPHQIIPLVIGRDRSITLVEEAAKNNMTIALITQKDGKKDEPQPQDLFTHGTEAQILKLFKMPDGSQHIVVQGLHRIKITNYTQYEPYYEAEIEKLIEKEQKDVRIEAMMLNLKNLVQKAVDMAPYLSQEMGIVILNTEDPSRLSDLVASFLNQTVEEKEEILETLSVKSRLEKVTKALVKEVELLELSKKIQTDVQGEIDKTQRDYYLREQMKAIQKELGEEDERTVEINEINEKIDKAKMPKEAKKTAKKELDRLSKMNPAAAEYTVSRTYLDWLTDIPWSKKTRDNLNITGAQQILNEDHYGLDKVKKRILEFLAVRQLKKDMKGPILCFAGPPGVGKTSLGKSIARALGRKFVRMSLGGVRDEAEIRGHRRTYVGALPGRIIQGIKRSGSNNPVFMLDEIDKLGMDFRGDPSSALLEVLDPEQNHEFSDHYLEVPFDLSKVLFIATANYVDPIPPALRDRMEFIELPGYTLEEKVNIAAKFLEPKQVKEHGLTGKEIHFTDAILSQMIQDYTREAGVRNLEREIAAVCRGVAREKVEKNGRKKIPKRTIKKQELEKYLGPVKFFNDVAERTAKSGVATGMAWTPVGGDILFIEATQMPGKGRMNLTGKLGDIMKESAQAALSFTRANAKKYKINPSFFEKNDIHIHVPSGAIPKDGPSAGVTIFTALVSLLTNRKVRHDIAMTGEITLRGSVLPVGGIKDKVLAARRAGISDIILPAKNKKDLVDIPEKIRKDITFHYIDEMDQVLDLTLVQKGRKKKKPGKKRTG